MYGDGETAKHQRPGIALVLTKDQNTQVSGLIPKIADFILRETSYGMSWSPQFDFILQRPNIS